MAPTGRRNRNRVRRRPVSFGNPALGTYHGCLYTLEGQHNKGGHYTKPLVEGAEAVERLVVMVDVPPEQVPEGILNLARSYRPYIHHVRIVIAEDDDEKVLQNNESIMSSDEQSSSSEYEESDDEDSVDHRSAIETTGSNFLHSASETAMESAASILAADEMEKLPTNLTTTETRGVHDIFPGMKSYHDSDDFINNMDIVDRPSRTYIILYELCSEEAADMFVEDLHMQPYTSLDETQTCSVHHVVALTGEDGVSLLSPFFAPSATTLPSSVDSPTSGKRDDDGTANAASSPTNRLSAPATTEDYNCAVCLDHMNLAQSDGERTSILTTVCNHTFHMDCLLQWQDSPCPVCRYDHSGLNEALSRCNICGSTENNFVCLICGLISCGGRPSRPYAGHSENAANQSNINASCCESGIDGYGSGATHTSVAGNISRLSASHAMQHYDATLHAYALDTDTQHVWDFAGQGYVHRLLQNKEDGKLVEVHDPSNTSSHERSLSPGLSDAQEGEVVHRKLEGFASQYYTLLKSQLEQQRTYYEGRLEELRRECDGKRRKSAIDFITALKQERNQLNKRLVSLKGRNKKVLEDVAFIKSMNESLEANKGPLKIKVKETQRQRIEARDLIQQRLPILENKVTMLMLQLEENVDVEKPKENASAVIPNNDQLADDRKPAAKK